MRLVTWNCRVGGFKRKAIHIARLRPDVLVVQEVEPLENGHLDGDWLPTFWDRFAEPRYPGRGLGVFSYTGATFQAVDNPARLSMFRRYEATCSGIAFNVVGVWNWKTRSVRTSYRQAHEGLAQHSDWIKERPTVVLGDFNANRQYRIPDWTQLENLLDRLDLVSAYHQHFGEDFGSEKRPTYFHKGKQGSEFHRHLDYCFIPKAWVRRIKDVTLGTYEDWHTISDHAPLVVDLTF